MFVGYAASGTLARRIIDGAKQVNIFGEDIAVRARIYTINGFSARADRRSCWPGKSRPARSVPSLFTAEDDACGSSRRTLPTLTSKCRSLITFSSCDLAP